MTEPFQAVPHMNHQSLRRMPTIPPLENGDRLTRQEFERRYEAMPRIKRAELIEGIVHMPSPVRYDIHGRPHAHVIGWLGVYVAATPGVQLADNTTVRLDPDNEVQPDALLRVEPSMGGQSRVDSDGYVTGAPELIAEIAATSASYDLHDKLRVYRRNGVQEYLVWQTHDGRIDWFQLQEGRYVPKQPDGSGMLHSICFPGLWLAVTDLLEGRLASVLEKLQGRLAAEEHAAFVRQLSAAG